VLRLPRELESDAVSLRRLPRDCRTTRTRTASIVSATTRPSHGIRDADLRVMRPVPAIRAGPSQERSSRSAAVWLPYDCPIQTRIRTHPVGCVSGLLDEIRSSRACSPAGWPFDRGCAEMPRRAGREVVPFGRHTGWRSAREAASSTCSALPRWDVFVEMGIAANETRRLRPRMLRRAVSVI
jgi:hypothetical protein